MERLPQRLLLSIGTFSTHDPARQLKLTKSSLNSNYCVVRSEGLNCFTLRENLGASHAALHVEHVVEIMVYQGVRWETMPTSIEVIAVDSDLDPFKFIEIKDTFFLMENDDNLESEVIVHGSFESKAVRFAVPLVTHCWEIPRMNYAARKELFYSPVQIAR